MRKSDGRIGTHDASPGCGRGVVVGSVLLERHSGQVRVISKFQASDIAQKDADNLTYTGTDRLSTYLSRQVRYTRRTVLSFAPRLLFSFFEKRKKEKRKRTARTIIINKKIR